MLVESGAGRPDRPEDEPARGREIPWSAIGWTAVVVWLLAASLVTTGIGSVALGWAALLVVGWRVSRMLGGDTGGMRDYKQ
jgi:hypothetical protein